MAGGVSMHPLESRYGRMVGFENEFSLRTGFFSARVTAAKTEHSSVVANGVVANGVEADGAIVNYGN